MAQGWVRQEGLSLRWAGVPQGGQSGVCVVWADLLPTRHPCPELLQLTWWGKQGTQELHGAVWGIELVPARGPSSTLTDTPQAERQPGRAGEV